MTSIRQLLNDYKEELQNEPRETEATKQFAKDIDDMSKEYDGVPAIVAKYRVVHREFADKSKSAARIQRDEVESWSNDPDEVPLNLQQAIRNLRDGYSKKAETIETDLDNAKAALNAVGNRLDKAIAADTDNLASYMKIKDFENTAKKWFDDVSALHKEAKEHLDARNYRLVYALFLEVEATWTKIRNLDEAVEGKPPRTADWLLQQLNTALTAAVEAKRERFLAHKERLLKKDALTKATENHKEFIEENGRRKQFVREAQDVPPVPDQTAAYQPAAAQSTAEAASST